MAESVEFGGCEGLFRQDYINGCRNTFSAHSLGLYPYISGNLFKENLPNLPYMPDFFLHALPTSVFEELAGHLCQEVLGTGTIVFSEGKDGGRDGTFEGTANKFPSEKECWSGKFLIQAKRRNNPDSSCTDPEFGKLLDKELPKVKKLCSDGEVDYYLLFTSRKLSGNASSPLLVRIKTETGVKDAKILGKEWINLQLSRCPDICRTLNLTRHSAALRIFPENIRAVIEAFAKNQEVIAKALAAPYHYDFEPDIEKKNALNKLSEAYFKNIQDRYQSYFHQVQAFLKDPINQKYQQRYYNIVEEINNKLLTHRDEYERFEEIFDELYDQIYAATPEQWEDSRIIYVFLHFMYCNCDIGEAPK